MWTSGREKWNPKRSCFRKIHNVKSKFVERPGQQNRTLICANLGEEEPLARRTPHHARNFSHRTRAPKRPGLRFALTNDGTDMAEEAISWQGSRLEKEFQGNGRINLQIESSPTKAAKQRGPLTSRSIQTIQSGVRRPLISAR